MKRALGLSLVLLCISAATLNSQAQHKSKAGELVDTGGTCGCVVDHDPNRPPPTMISGGILNEKALSLPRPDFGKPNPRHGNVNVQVVVGEDGSVIKASVIGDSQLKAAAETAALSAKFSQTLLSGKPIKVSGVIVYKY